MALGLAPTEWRDRLVRIVTLAAALHDLGKANDHFQGLVRHDRARLGKPQGLRHEWVTLGIIQRPDFHHWLLPALGSGAEAQENWHVVLWAIGGHHPAFGRPSPPREAPPGAGETMLLLLGEPDFEKCLDWLGETFELDPARRPRCENLSIPLAGAPCPTFAELQQAFMQHARLWQQWKSGADPQSKCAFVAIVKNTLVGADVAGSAIPRVIEPTQRHEWCSRAFAQVPEPGELREIIAARLTDEQTGTVAELRPFQRLVAQQAGDVTFVRAGCGSGKTLAAYHWAAQRCPSRRLYFCYPTTGTATEGFRDYLFEPDERVSKHGARLFHGRADVDLELVVGVDSAEESRVKDPANNTGRSSESSEGDPRDESQELDRIESLDAWTTPIATCTVDTVLGVMQNNRRGLYAWPALAGAAFVFDEIHAYDEKLFGSLLRFIQTLRGVPVLIMTASLPTSRVKLLEEAVMRRGSTLAVPSRTPDLEELETRRRYHRQGEVDSRDPLEEITIEYKKGGKVLWVCNTVDRVMASAERAQNVGLNPLVYHSRFRYEDRVQRHESVIAAFRPKENPGAVVAVCSQVAEMSLDLKGCTMLVTDLAPVPPLIQRLGRLNRDAAAVAATRPFLVIVPRTSDGKLAAGPYSEDELELARHWLRRLPASGISQRHLAEAWESMDAVLAEGKPPLDSAWLDGGPQTLMKELRGGSIGITVILRSDAEVHHAAPLDQRPPLAQLLLPMPAPKWLCWREWPKYRGVPVAPNELVDYSRTRGARWLTKERPKASL